jgi:hypothetical protein
MREADLLSDEHFSVDGTLIRDWASHKSLGQRTIDHTDADAAVLLDGERLP